MKTLAVLFVIVVAACSPPGDNSSRDYPQPKRSGIAPPPGTPYHDDWCEAARIVEHELQAGFSMNDATMQQRLADAADQLEQIPGQRGLAISVRAIAEATTDSELTEATERLNALPVFNDLNTCQ